MYFFLVLQACLFFTTVHGGAQGQEECGISSVLKSTNLNSANAISGQWPWHALLYVKSSTNSDYLFHCDGTLVKPEWIITAAHCIEKLKTTDMMISLGVNERHKSEQGKQSHFVEASHIHEGYIGTGKYIKNDIALLKLRTKVTYDEYVRPVCLPSLETPTPKIGDPCVISGFGSINNSNILRHRNIEITSCDLIGDESSQNVSKDHICAESQRFMDECYSNNGGPLVCTKGNEAHTLFGVTSSDENCDKKRRPELHTNILGHLTWIRDVMNSDFAKERSMNTSEVVDSRSNTTTNDSWTSTSFNNLTGTRFTSTTSVPSTTTEKYKGKCGVPRIFSSRIVNGDDATPGQWPWQASVYIISSDSISFCGGTLIQPRWVLSAAHCVDNPTIFEIRVDLGVNDRLKNETTTQSHVVQDVYVPNGYIGEANTFKYDVALLKLYSEVIYNDYVLPACLPSLETIPLQTGETCVISGFGETLGTAIPFTVLQYAEVGIISFELCELWYKQSGINIPDGHFCAGYRDGGVDTCQGDSGGPVVCQRADDVYYVFGITSFGEGCALKRRPGVYTDVGKYIYWIYDILGIPLPPTTTTTTTTTTTPTSTTTTSTATTSTTTTSTATTSTTTTSTSSGKRLSSNLFCAVFLLGMQLILSV